MAKGWLKWRLLAVDRAPRSRLSWAVTQEALGTFYAFPYLV